MRFSLSRLSGDNFWAARRGLGPGCHGCPPQDVRASLSGVGISANPKGTKLIVSTAGCNSISLSSGSDIHK